MGTAKLMGTQMGTKRGKKWEQDVRNCNWQLHITS